MATGILIMGSAGAGKTTLGKIVAQQLDYKFVDIDDYIWRWDTEQPFTIMYSREDKIKNLMNAIADTNHFVMAGSMNSFHEHFDPFFELVVHLDASASVRIERVNQRESKRFGERIMEGGDLYEEHKRFLDDIAGYEFGYGSTTLKEHKAWLDSIQCKVIKLDGAKPLDENATCIIREYKNIKNHD